MRVLVVGDRFIPAGYCVDAVAGPVVTPKGIVDAVGDAEVPAVRFAPVLRAAPPLRAVCVARAGLGNVTITTRYACDTTATTVRWARLVAETVAVLAATGGYAAAVDACDLGWV